MYLKAKYWGKSKHKNTQSSQHFRIYFKPMRALFRGGKCWKSKVENWGENGNFFPPNFGACWVCCPHRGPQKNCHFPPFLCPTGEYSRVEIEGGGCETLEDEMFWPWEKAWCVYILWMHFQNGKMVEYLGFFDWSEQYKIASNDGLLVTYLEHQQVFLYWSFSRKKKPRIMRYT